MTNDKVELLASIFSRDVLVLMRAEVSGGHEGSD
jgi:hypothetical protein